MDFSLLVLCLCLFNGVFGVETEHRNNAEDPIDTSETLLEHSGENPEAEHSGENPETEHSGDSTNFPGVISNFLHDDAGHDDDNDDAADDIVHGQFISKINVTEGVNVTLGSGSIIRKNAHIIWTCESQHSNATIGINANAIYYENIEQYGDRLHVNDRTGSLTLTNIRTTDSGRYYQNTVSTTSKVVPRKFCVTVFERLFTPRITDSTNCSSSSERSSSSKCVLLCSVMNVSHVSLSWYKGNSLLSSISVSDLNIRLSLPLEVEYQDTNTYTCVINNPITNQTQHLNINDVCQQCPTPRQFYPILGLLALLLLIIIGICLYCCYVRSEKIPPDHLVNSSITEMDSMH